jgi:hypothetical protein
LWNPEEYQLKKIIPDEIGGKEAADKPELATTIFEQKFKIRQQAKRYSNPQNNLANY